MALQHCSLNLDKTAKELRPHGDLGFPCAGYSSYYTDKPEDTIPWHWHEEIEIIYMESGQMKVRIPSKSFLLSEIPDSLRTSHITLFSTSYTQP